MKPTVENREAFFQRLQPFFPPTVLLNIQVAYTLAKFGHRAQQRQEKDSAGQPLRYFEHVRRVTLILVDEVQILLPEMVVGGLLHDGIEDTRELTPEMIEHLFGPDTCQIVKTLSKAPKEGYLERFMLSTDWRPYVLKACDRLDNLRSLAQSSLAFQAKQVAETREKLFPLFDRMVSITPEEFRPRVSRLRDAVITETARRAAILEVTAKT